MNEEKEEYPPGMVDLTVEQIEQVNRLAEGRQKGKPFSVASRGLNPVEKHVAGLIAELGVHWNYGGKLDLEFHGKVGDLGKSDIEFPRGHRGLIKALVRPDLRTVYIPVYEIEQALDEDYIIAVRVDLKHYRYKFEGWCRVKDFKVRGTVDSRHYHRAETIPGYKNHKEICSTLNLRWFKDMYEFPEPRLR